MEAAKHPNTLNRVREVKSLSALAWSRRTKTSWIKQTPSPRTHRRTVYPWLLRRRHSGIGRAPRIPIVTLPAGPLASCSTLGRPRSPIGAGGRRGPCQVQQGTVACYDEVSDEGILSETSSPVSYASDDGGLQFDATFGDPGGIAGAEDVALRTRCLGKGVPLSVPVMLVLRSLVRALAALKRDVVSFLASVFKVDSHRMLVIRVAAAISGVSASSVTRAWQSSVKKLEDRLDRHNAAAARHRDTHTLRDRRVSSGGGRPSEADRRTTMKNIIRTAIAAAVEGQSFYGYERMLHRMRLASAQVGHRYQDRKFAARVVQMAGLVLRQLDAHDWQSRLPGIGIASDFAVLADPVSLGVQIRSKHDVLNVMCLAVVGCGGQIYCPFFAAPAMPFGSHGGREMCKLMVQTLEEHPAVFGRGVLRRRLSSVCGDGALTLGGPDHRHSSTKAAELLWRTVHAELQGQVPDMTSWDAFHRVDVAAWRAVKRVPMAQAVFEVAKQLDILFGVDEGVLLYRGAVAAMALQATAIRAPGGTRKVGYLAGTPGSVLQNYKAIIGSIHARLAWISEGRSSQTISHLSQVCRILTDASFIAFSAFLDDLLGKTLHPFSTQVQKAIEPAVFARAQRRLMGRLRQLPDQLRSTRRLLRVISLCRQWVTAIELKTLWLAHASSGAGLMLPNLWRAVAEMLTTATPCYQGVELASAEFLDPSISHCLGPHCQCPGRIAAGGALRVPVVVRGRRVLVPPWVAHGSRLQTYDGDLVGVSARWQTWPLGADVPPGLRNVLRIRRASCTGCRVPHDFFITHDSLDGALKAAAKLVVELHLELDQILGSVGVNDGMASLLQNVAKCFDWGSLARQAPSADHVLAFREVASVMEPLMRLTDYPVHADFQDVSRTWPAFEELAVQYVVLCRRVRDAAAGAGLREGEVPNARRPPAEVAQAARRWSKVVAYKVSPVWSRGVLRHVLRTCLARASRNASVSPSRTARSAVLYEVCTLVCLFEGEVPEEAFKTYRVSVNSLSPARGLHRHLAIKVSRDLGHDRARKLVRVIAEEIEVDISAVSAAVDMHAWFSVGHRRGRPPLCWHVARLHHRCRLLAPPDAACESIGSQMRWLWDQRMSSISPTVFADKVHLTSAGVSCLGGDRDETIVETILLMLEKASLKKLTPFEGVRRSSTTKRLHVAEKLMRLKDSGRNHIGVDESHVEALSVSLWEEAAPGLAAHHQQLKGRARAGWPTDLPAVLVEVLSRVTRGPRMPTVLPSVDLMHVDGRNVAVSVRNRAVAAWFASEDGQKWGAERRRLLHHGEPDAIISTRSSRDIAGADGDANGSRAAEPAGSASSAPSAPPSASRIAAARPPAPTDAAGIGGRGRGRGRGDAAPGGRGRGRGRGGDVAYDVVGCGRGDAAAGGRGRGDTAVGGRGAAGTCGGVSGSVSAASAGNSATSSAAIGGAATKKCRR